MATDGVKIIDGDLAHDTYTTLISKFEEGSDLETIKKEALEGKEYLDEFDYEILFTAYALALWEIGYLDKETENEVKRVIAKGACIKKWRDWEPSLGKQREKVIEKFLAKISTPKKNPIKRKKFKQVQSVFFEDGDVVVLRFDGKSYVSVITVVQKIRNYCIYSFGITDFEDVSIPTLNDFLESNLLINKIGCWESEESIRTRQPGVKEFFGTLKHDEEVSANYFIGITYIDVEHRKLKKMLQHFSKIGNIKIIDGFKYRGSGGYKDSFEGFSEMFKSYIDNFQVFKLKKFPTRAIIEKSNLPI